MAVIADITNFLNDMTTVFSSRTNLLFILAFFTTVIVIYSVFVFNFYRFLAKKNIIELNLNQYNQYSNPAAVKFFAVIFFTIEYLILLPILTFFWFTILSILTLILAKELEINTVLLISAALVASVRATAYVNEDLAKDLAKMLPFTLLAIAITTAGFFNIGNLVSRISEIPSLFSNIPYYLLFIVAVELIMRTGEFVENAVESSKSTEEENETE
ncbi:MAG: hypothetical protein V1889_02115 [archaeon]